MKIVLLPGRTVCALAEVSPTFWIRTFPGLLFPHLKSNHVILEFKIQMTLRYVAYIPEAIQAHLHGRHLVMFLAVRERIVIMSSLNVLELKGKAGI
jgi:hypothetical protein